VIEYKSLATVTLPDFVINGIATSDVFGDDYYGDDHKANCDETVGVFPLEPVFFKRAGFI
jgi:hypothetical protein